MRKVAGEAKSTLDARLGFRTITGFSTGLGAMVLGFLAGDEPMPLL